MEVEKMNFQNKLDNLGIKKKNYNKIIIYCFFLFFMIYCVSIIYLFNKINYLNDIIHIINNKKFFSNIELKNAIQKEKFNENNNNNDLNKSFLKLDKDMVGLEYPEIFFEKLRNGLEEKNQINTLIDFFDQLEAKLIYLEKEINVTKLSTFFHIRTSYLKKNNVKYDDSKINELHSIISWLTIHKSTQLKGIASDKYLACKYAQLKLEKNLCSHRIGVYDKVEDIKFEELIKRKGIVLKISNGCNDLVYIFNNTKKDIEQIKKDITYYFNREFSLKIPEFFHLYSKKRILVEKIFIPISDLFEFKFFIINNNISFIMLFLKEKHKIIYFNSNFEFLYSKNIRFDILSIFKQETLSQLKEYAIKLSEDFKNFIRVDLYIFHNEIYLSELTFDSNNGMPMLADKQFIIDAGKNWKRVD